jgi:hypothetical protein
MSWLVALFGSDLQNTRHWNPADIFCGTDLVEGQSAEIASRFMLGSPL